MPRRGAADAHPLLGAAGEFAPASAAALAAASERASPPDPMLPTAERGLRAPPSSESPCRSRDATLLTDMMACPGLLKGEECMR
mmetsp:Transcript_23068/g.57939  ORF Transcript_23068/g.57939 Transcript_23068/m.57939 type:complete len:84 (-) Transcript_23068:522-773(-)